MTVISNQRITPQGCDEVRHIVLDRRNIAADFRAGKTIAIQIPAETGGADAGKTRYYSLASGIHGDTADSQTIALCVKRVTWIDPTTGTPQQSGAAKYLCELKPGDQVAVVGAFDGKLRFPADPAANVLMFATGTGVAPFRAFLAEAFHPDSPSTGQIWLVLGAKSRDECLYRQEFQSLVDQHPNFHFIPAHSREERAPGGERLYVDHRLADRIDAAWTLIGLQNTYIYICGKKGMEARILRVLEQHAAKNTQAAPGLLDHLIASGRLMVETY